MAYSHKDPKKTAAPGEIPRLPIFFSLRRVTRSVADVEAVLVLAATQRTISRPQGSPASGFLRPRDQQQTSSVQVAVLHL